MSDNRTVLSDYTQYNADDLYPDNMADFVDARSKVIVSNIQNRLPAIVQEYNPEDNTVLLKIAIKLLSPQRNSNGEYVSIDRAFITTTVKQPFANLSNGGIGIVYGLSKGDRGWVEASDRDTSLFKAGTMTDSIVPSSFSLSKYYFGSFTPDIINGYTLNSEDKGCLSIQTIDGSMRFVLDPVLKQIRVFCPNTIITGNVSVSGNITATGTITGNVDVIAGGISGKSHVHSGVDRGNSNTDSPVG